MIIMIIIMILLLIIIIIIISIVFNYMHNETMLGSTKLKNS